MSNFDWSASGIKNEFSFECVDIRKPDSHISWLDGVTGGKITQTYRGDYRASATLDVDGVELPSHCAIRIWHTASLNGESVTEELATLIPQRSSQTLERGRVTGSLDLYSPMKFLDSDLVTKNVVINKGQVAWKKFYNQCSLSGFSYLIDSNIQNANATLSSVWVWEHGKSALTMLQKMADVANGYITVDTHGRVVLKPYVNPVQVATGITLSTGIKSLIMLGVDISTGDICNKVIASYETGTDSNKKVYSAEAIVDPTHPWSFQHLGYWATEEINSPTFAENASETTINAQLQAAVKKALSTKSSYKRILGINMLYSPDVAVGRTMRLVYQDSDNGEKIDTNVFVSQKEIELTAAMQSSITCEERWSYGTDTLAVS